MQIKKSWANVLLPIMMAIDDNLWSKIDMLSQVYKNHDNFWWTVFCLSWVLVTNDKRMILCWRWCNGYDCFDWNGWSAVAWIMMKIHKKCTQGRHKARTKEGNNNAHGRHCSTGATHQTRARQILHSAWFSKYTTWLSIYHNACLKHSNFLNRNAVWPIVTHMEHHGNSKRTGDRRKTKNTPQQVEKGSTHHRICLILPRFQIYGETEHAQIRRLLHWTELLWMERMPTQDAQEKKINKNTLREEKKTSWINKRGSTWILENCWKQMTNEECVQNQSLWIKSRLSRPAQDNMKHRQMRWWIACRLRTRNRRCKLIRSHNNSSQVVSSHDFTTSARLVKNAVSHFRCSIAFSIVLTAL